MTEDLGDVPPGSAAVAAVRLWVAVDGSVAGRLTTVDDLAEPVEDEFVTTDLEALTHRLDLWLAVTARRLANR
jgi:hypothetical protein